VTSLEQQLLNDAAVFDRVEPPRGFRADLGKTIRHLPPPAPPPRPGLLRPAFRLALAAAAAIAFLLFLGNLASDNQNDAVVEGEGDPETNPVVYNPPEQEGSPVVLDSRFGAGDRGVAGVAAASVNGAGEVRSEFVDAKLEQEWMYIKADAKALSGPFRSAMPSALIRRH